VLAEQAAARKHQQTAMHLYDQAIEEARKNDFTQIEAMGSEWAARFYRRCGFLDIAVGYLRAARRAYLRWGATPKADDLRQTLQEWEPRSREAEMFPMNGDRTTTTDNMQLDLSTVVKAAATISGEIVTQNLLQKLINLVVENAGAQRGVLLLDSGDGLTVQAERLAETSSCILLQSTSLMDYFQVPQTVINYVARTRQRVVLTDAGREGRFAADPYIVQQQTKSVLCLPIVRSVKLIGVLYLENNLTRGAFTAERVGLLSMLSSQMAISIENADLYRNLQKAAEDLEEYNRDLESKVLRRTEELNRKNIDLNDALERVEQANHKIEESLQYARMIQESLLPSRERIAQMFPDSFLLWMPRDIVGGDVFFAEQVRDKRILVLADCTGHGVPGALMTVIVISALRQLVSIEGCVEPAEILQRLNFIVKTALQQDSHHARSDDGLDAAVCRIDSDFNALTFAGAALPLYCIKNGQLRFIRGDRQSIGYKRSDVAHRFATHRVELGNNSCVYLATDGYADQLGGEKGFPMGSNRLRKALLEHHRHPLPEQREYLYQAFNRYQGEFPRQDDVTLLGLKF
jgi:GAF domain-containing protein